MAGNYYNRYSPSNASAFQSQFSPRRPSFSDHFQNPYQQDLMFRTPSGIPPRPRFSPSSFSPGQFTNRPVYQPNSSERPCRYTPPNAFSDDLNRNTPGYQDCTSSSPFGDGSSEYANHSPNSFRGRSFSPRSASFTPRFDRQNKRPRESNNDSNPGGNNNILRYYRPSIMNDPWKGLTPVSTTTVSETKSH